MRFEDFTASEDAGLRVSNAVLQTSKYGNGFSFASPVILNTLTLAEITFRFDMTVTRQYKHTFRKTKAAIHLN